MDKCGMQWIKELNFVGDIGSEPMTKCGNYVCSDECYKTWAFCPYCGKSFDNVEKTDDCTV